MTRMRMAAPCAALTPGAAASAYAATIQDVGGNDSAATARRIDAHFTIGKDPEIADPTTVPNVKIVSQSPDKGVPRFDYDRVTNRIAGSRLTLDIDHG